MNVLPIDSHWREGSEPTPFEAAANRQAAIIAAREVRARAVHCPIHRASLEAWQAGERDWPWPDTTPEQRADADRAVRGLLSDEQLQHIAGGHRRFERLERRHSKRIVR